MAKTSPTQRTLAALRAQGRTCGIVERFIGPLNIRKDLFGIIDIIALDHTGVIGVQSCGTAYSAHMKKIVEEHRDDAIRWLEAPGTSLELWGWRKVKVKRGGKAMVYQPRVHVFSLEDFGVYREPPTFGRPGGGDRDRWLDTMGIDHG